MPFFASGLYKILGKLADRILFGVQGPRTLGLGCRSLCLQGAQGLGLGCRSLSGLYTFTGKLADRIFVGVQGPRGLGLGRFL